MIKKLKIEGMSCQHCLTRVKKTIEKNKAVLNADVDLQKGEAMLTCNDEHLDILKVIDNLKEIGFESTEPE